MIWRLFKERKNELILAAIIFGVVIFSLQTLTTKPRLWTDEGLSIELARNFLFYGRLDLMTAPMEFSGRPFLLQSTGYPLTLLLAGFLKLFGVNLVSARIFALLLMIVFLVSVWWFVKKIFGVKHAFIVILLLATFAPFYGIGRCATGEVVGSIFLLPGLYYLLYKNKIFLGGLIVGLAVAAKPSVYLLVGPAILVVFLIEWRGFWPKSLKFIAGLIPAMALWVGLNIPSLAAWQAIFNFYKNPFGRISIVASTLSNLANWPHSTTLIYFSVLFLIFLAALLWDKDFFKSNKNLFIFISAYVVLAGLYFLKSPGWLRYLVVAQFLIFTILSPAGEAIINKWVFPEIFWLKNKKWIFYGFFAFLIMAQTVHLAIGADMFYSRASTETVDFLNRQGRDKTIGLVNAMEIGGLILSEKKYQLVNSLLGLPTLGEDFLTFDASRLPVLVVAAPSETILARRQNIIAEFYELIFNNEKYHVYVRR